MKHKKLIKKLNRFYEKFVLIFIYFFLVIGLVFIIIGFILFFKHYQFFDFTTFEFNSNQDFEINAKIGDFIGGVIGSLWALAGVLLFYTAVVLQGKELRAFKLDSQKQNFENRFFELVKIHINNRNEINIGQENKKHGRAAFTYLHDELSAIWNVIDQINKKFDYNVCEKDKINITYLTLFYGAIGEKSVSLLTTKLKKDFANSPANIDWSQFVLTLSSALEKEKESNSKLTNFHPFNGNQHRLGTYFRHFFQTVKYVNNLDRKYWHYKQRYEYVKTLRAQLCSHEQVILFFNSLSSLGKPWEKKEGLSDDQKLITKYNLIKNIPEAYFSDTYNINVKDKAYYPLAIFEWDGTRNESRINLERNYS